MKKSIDDQMEIIGQAADRIDNLLSAANMPLPDKTKLDCTLKDIEEISKQLKTVVIEVTGENPWE